MRERIGVNPSSGTALGSAFAAITFKRGRLSEVRVHPVELGWRSLPRPQQGRPKLTDPNGEVAKTVLARIQKFCRALGSELAIRDGTGVIQGPGT